MNRARERVAVLTPVPSAPEPEPSLHLMHRCKAERNGHRCLLEPGHDGQHMASNGVPFLYWDPADARQYHSESTLGSMVWIAWAKALGIDPVRAQTELMACCRSANVHPSIVLASLFV